MTSDNSINFFFHILALFVVVLPVQNSLLGWNCNLYLLQSSKSLCNGTNVNKSDLTLLAYYTCYFVNLVCINLHRNRSMTFCIWTNILFLIWVYVFVGSTTRPRKRVKLSRFTRGKEIVHQPIWDTSLTISGTLKIHSEIF